MTSPHPHATALGGTLIREGRHRWAWRDGTPEPRVRDLSPDEWNFRCRTYGKGGTYVEVLRGAAQESDALAWVIQGAREGRYRSGASGDHTGPLDLSTGERLHIPPGTDPLLGAEPILARGPIPSVILVPVAEWDAWVAEHPAGAEWDMRDQDAILARAKALGWEAPE